MSESDTDMVTEKSLETKSNTLTSSAKHLLLHPV